MKRKKDRVQLKTLLSTMISMVANMQSNRGKQPPPPPLQRTSPPPQRNKPTIQPSNRKTWAAVAAKPTRQTPRPWGNAKLRQPDWDLPVTDGTVVINNPAVTSAVFLLPTNQLSQLQRRNNNGRLTAITTEDPGNGTPIQVSLLVDGKSVIRKAYMTAVSGTPAKSLIPSGNNPQPTAVIQIHHHSGHSGSESLSTADLFTAVTYIYNQFAKQTNLSAIDRHQIWESKLHTPRVQTMNIRVPTSHIHPLQLFVTEKHRGYFVSIPQRVQSELSDTTVIKLNTVDYDTAFAAAKKVGAALIITRRTNKLSLVQNPERELITRQEIGLLAMPPPTPGSRFYITGPNLHRLSSSDMCKILAGQGWAVEEATHIRKKGSRGYFVVKSLEEPNITTFFINGHGLLSINKEAKREVPSRSTDEFPPLPSSQSVATDVPMEIDSSADNTTSTLPPIEENSTNLTSNNSSQQQLTEKDARIRDLQDYQQQMQVQNLHLSEKINAMTDRISDLLANQKASQLEASSHNESKEARIQTLIEQQSSMQQQNAVLTAEVTGLTNQTTDLLKNLQAAQDTNSSLTSEKDAHIRKLMDQQERMQQQVSDLVKDHQKAQQMATSQAAQKDAHIEELLERQGQMQQQISELMARLDNSFQNSSSVPTSAPHQNSDIPNTDPSHPSIEISSVPKMKAPPKKSNNNTILSRSRSKSLMGRESDMAAQLLGSFSPYGDRSGTPGKSRGRSPRRDITTKK